MMADERERGRFCSVAHLFSLSLFFPPFLSLSLLKQQSPPPPKTSLCSCFKSSHRSSFTLPIFHIHKTLIHPIPVFPLICYRFHTCLFQDSLHAASKHYTHMLLLCLISNPGPLMCCHNSRCSFGKTFLEISESGSSPFRCCCSAALKQTAAMKLETQCGLKQCHAITHISSDMKIRRLD